MRKTILLLALGMFLSASVTANACNHDKACAKATKGAVCTKAAKAKASLTKDGKNCTVNSNCAIKECPATANCPVQNCPNSSSCTKGMKASKASKTMKATAEKS
ncbi:MAG: hypothetical protein ACHQM6_01830 [Candidatus Kapaibacterium sp.]